MGMRISTNVTSIAAQRALTGTQRMIQSSMNQLASGSRINRASDDAAGLAISENLKSQIRSYSQAGRNTNDGISMVQVAEGGLGEISNILTRMRELAIQSSSDTVAERERGFIDKEVQQLKSEVERISQTTAYGGVKLINGSAEQFDFQVGIQNDVFNDRISFMPGEADATAGNLGISSFDFSSKDGAQTALEGLDTAQVQVNGYRANLGALQNRLQSTADNLLVMHENISAANSRIRDTDIAAASAENTRNTILLQATNSILAQANTVPQMALKLVG